MDQGDFYLVQFVGVPSYSSVKPKFITAHCLKMLCHAMVPHIKLNLNKLV